MMASLGATVVNALRTVLYGIGALGLYHRFRNARTLTVLMFHRVLPADSPAFRRAEREFTFSVEGFAACLDFVKRHYHVVDLDRLMAARNGGRPLPPRAALITFDDGWRDTIDHAYPQLVKRGIPAVLFLSTEVLESDSNRWWQDALVEATTDPARVVSLAHALGIGGAEPPDMHTLAAALVALPTSRRMELLSRFVDCSDLSRQMLVHEDLAGLDPYFLAVAAHGHSHAPLTAVANAADELALSHARVAEIKGNQAAMSFPHGAFSSETVAAARKAGFEWIFSSLARLNSFERVDRQDVLGRIHVPENEWTCTDGHIAPERLATFLFFRPLA